ncbi:iron-sulfur cluster biosynthesis family protein [Liquorilactobacillus mali]|uniref:iron-sulfur cluster biosynthesis family protein n=1 Tax=Liquorilactobacillus mali TaxID=1618 RepID=UPI002350858D|nr:iron-sulfur cluster biosynthesis family protein [Liquorilactobacillus mali]MDC7952838.1 iron-sulfur cluster biosynthesis family protein [Liquorilactobacillus mali]
MFLEITPTVQEKLKNFLKKPEVNILLNFDDGVGIYSKVQATCGLEVNFNLIIVNKTADLTDFNDQILTNICPFLIKGYSREFLDEKNSLVLTKYGSISLKGEKTGIITGNLPILDLSREQIHPVQARLEPIDEIAN